MNRWNIKIYDHIIYNKFCVYVWIFKKMAAILGAILDFSARPHFKKSMSVFWWDQ